MGSDNLFHKRKAKKHADTQRRQAFRQPYDRILIVCEGEKTEPIYFEEARILLEIDSANIEIDGSCGSSPMSVVTHALKAYGEEKERNGLYDKVFCVFDKDTHSTFNTAINQIEQINAKYKTKPFKAIWSIPAFEYWLLLHFTPTTKPYMSTLKKSCGAQVTDDLKKYIPDYTKKMRGIFKRSVEDKTLKTAMAHSKRIFSDAQRNNPQSSSTNIHELIEYLQNVKK